MALLYKRQIKVEVAGLVITEPRINYEFERTSSSTTATSAIRIYNLKPENEDRIYERSGPVKLSAGYPQTLALVLDGTVERVERGRDTLERITYIEVNNKVVTRETLGGVTARSYSGDVTIRELVRDLITLDLKLIAGPLDAIPASENFTNFAWSGKTSGALSYLLLSINCAWYEDDGVIRVRRKGKPEQSDSIRMNLNKGSGLIGSPSVTEEGEDKRLRAQAKTLLDPAYRIGTVVDIESLSLEGAWVVVGLRHRADNWQGAFETHLKLREL